MFHMTGESTSVVRKMLDYLYTGDYSDPCDESPTNESPKTPVLSVSPLQLHAQLFALGDQYIIPELCDVAAEKYLSRIVNQFEPLEYFDSLPDVFFSPLNHNKKLQELAVRSSRDKLEYVLRANTTIRAKYDSIAIQVPEFVKEMLDSYFDAPVVGNCPDCGYQNTKDSLQAKCRGCGGVWRCDRKN